MLGIVWAILLPLTTIVLIYFVLTHGLKAGVVGSVSFASWLIPGMLAWFFISEGISNSVTTITDYSYLVTKTVFPVRLLVPARLCAAMPVHFFLMTGFMGYLFFSNQEISLKYWGQLPYYFGCACTLMFGMSLITSAVQVFVKDLSNAVGVILQIFFWATPLFWNPDLVKNSPFKWILLSPFNYVVTGYRDSLFDGIGFWQRPIEAMTFWFSTVFILCLGVYTFKKLRPHFADVL